MHFPLLLAALLLISLPAKAEPLDSIAAVVNNEAITCYEVQQDTKNILMQLRQSGSTFLPSIIEISQRSLDARVDKMLQLQKARKLQLKVGKEELDNASEKIESRNNLLPGQLKATLKQQGVDFEQFKDNMHDQLLISKLINAAVRSKLQVSEESIREYYRKYLAAPKARREVQLGQIFLSLPAEPSPELLATVRNKIRNIHKQLENGKGFSQLVAIYSESPDRQQQGVMGWFTKGSISQRFAPALELPVNGLSDPIRSPSGFHILKALNERWIKPEKLGKSYDEVHARHILLRIPSMADEETRAKIRSRAEALATEMKGVSDKAFATRAKEVSQGPSSSQGGDLGWFRKGAMLPAFDKAVFAMKAGETSGLVKTKFGLHIIRLVARRHVDPGSLQANRDKITQILTNVKMQEQVPRWIASLRADATLKYQSCPNSNAATNVGQSVSQVVASQPESSPPESSPPESSPPESSQTVALPSKALDIEVKAALERWRSAWASQNLKAYFAAYSGHFNSGKNYASLAAWKFDRRKSIGDKKYIRIGISNIKISPLEQNRARVEFDQHYETGKLKHNDFKLLLMEKMPSGWKIIREMTAASAP